MSKESKAQMQGQIDKLKEQVAELQQQIKLMAFLHTELAFQAGMSVATIVWLHDERGFHLQEFIESENRLISRARAVKAARAAQTQAQMGLPQ